MTDNEFAPVQVVRVKKVEDHPDSELKHLSLVYVLDHTIIAGKGPEGDHRDSVRDLMVYFPVGSIIPEPWLKFQGWYWDTAKNRGMLGGNKKNRVVPLKRGSVESNGLIVPVTDLTETKLGGYVCKSTDQCLYVEEGNFVGQYLGVTMRA